jgi:N-acetylglutamate synthase-like GNAT family acetyltransferase
MRDFIPGDQGLRQLILTGLQHRWGDAYDPRFNGDLEDFESNYIKRGAEIVVIELNHKLVATGTLVPDGSNSGRIVRMSVAGPNRRKGLARRVVSELVARARRQGMSEVRVLTDTPWASAVELYRSCGFVEVASDERETHFTMQL